MSRDADALLDVDAIGGRLMERVMEAGEVDILKPREVA